MFAVYNKYELANCLKISMHIKIFLLSSFFNIYGYILFLQDLENGAGVDFYLEGGLICWGDHDLEVIQCTSYNGSHVSSNKTTVRYF